MLLHPLQFGSSAVQPTNSEHYHLIQLHAQTKSRSASAVTCLCHPCAFNQGATRKPDAFNQGATRN